MNAELIGRVRSRLVEYFGKVDHTDFSLVEPEEKRTAEDKTPLTALIDHTLLKPEATGVDIDRVCDEAAHHQFASVCVNPCWVDRAAKRLEESSVKVCTVIGFPLGAATSQVKAYEAAQAIDLGADEIDMVINIGALLAGEYEVVYEDIRAVVKASSGRAVVKVIIETALLSEEKKIAACILASSAGADFVKTSTGFAGGGATIDDVALMRAVVGSAMGVKASGGIRDYAGAKAMVRAGADRLGTSSGVAIAKGEVGNSSY